MERSQGQVEAVEEMDKEAVEEMDTVADFTITRQRLSCSTRCVNTEFTRKLRNKKIYGTESSLIRRIRTERREKYRKFVSSGLRQTRFCPTRRSSASWTRSVDERGRATGGVMSLLRRHTAFPSARLPCGVIDWPCVTHSTMSSAARLLSTRSRAGACSSGRAVENKNKVWESICFATILSCPVLCPLCSVFCVLCSALSCVLSCCPTRPLESILQLHGSSFGAMSTVSSLPVGCEKTRIGLPLAPWCPRSVTTGWQRNGVAAEPMQARMQAVCRRTRAKRKTQNGSLSVNETMAVEAD